MTFPWRAGTTSKVTFAILLKVGLNVPLVKVLNNGGSTLGVYGKSCVIGALEPALTALARIVHGMARAGWPAAV